MNHILGIIIQESIVKAGKLETNSAIKMKASSITDIGKIYLHNDKKKIGVSFFPLISSLLP